MLFVFFSSYFHNNIIYFQFVNDKACVPSGNSHMKGAVVRNTVSICICDVMDGTDSVMSWMALTAMITWPMVYTMDRYTMVLWKVEMRGDVQIHIHTHKSFDYGYLDHS